MGRHEIDPRTELGRAELGDRRLNARLEQLVAVLQDAPDRSFPSAMETDAELEAAYRFFRNDKVTLDRLIEPHVESTVERARQASSVLLLHDTSEFRYGGTKPRNGLGRIANDGQGFYGHFALAVSGDAEHAPLGLAGLLTYTRSAEPRRINKVDYLERRLVVRESARWAAVLLRAVERFGHVDPVHVMDREADDFELLSLMVNKSARFVVRMTTQRRRKGTSTDVDTSSPYLEDIARAAPSMATREVPLSRRANKRGGRTVRTHPSRERRVARLEFAATTVEVAPPRRLKRRFQALCLGIVSVREKSPPKGEAPIEWLLMTNEPIGTAEEVLTVVDMYRARWTIEEYFKALKTGCSIERRQLESREALEAALGLFAPIAVRLLALRSRARLAPGDSATRVLASHELAALRTLAREPLPRSPTVRDVLLAIARLGGHLKRNGDPGWQVLSRGWEKLEIGAQVVAALVDGKPAL